MHSFGIKNSWFCSHTTQVMLIYNYFGNCAILLNIRHLGILWRVFLALSECSLTLETLFWNQRLSIYFFYKSSYFITNLVMAALAPYYFRFSAFPDCSPKIFIFSLFFQKFWCMTQYSSKKFFTKYNISTDKNIAMLFIISSKLYFQFLNLCAHISTRTFQNIKFEL